MRLFFAILLAVLPSFVFADDAVDYRELHREAAQKYYESFQNGLMLSGSIAQNDSEGTFKALFHDDSWLVRYTYGDLESYSYYGAEGNWAGSNYSLPYQIEDEDNPSSAVMNLLSSGKYLEEPWWDDFHYLGEDASGYNFTFTPEGMPPVTLVMYSDKAEPEYLQVMTSEVKFAVDDPDCLTYRTYYYYTTDDDGRLITDRETSSEIDANGERMNFTSYDVDSVQVLDEMPADFSFDFSRTPIGNPAPLPEEGVTVDIVVKGAYMFLPLKFDGSDTTHLFLLDTGASASLFTPAAADDAKFESSLNTKAHGHGTSADFSIGMCTSASLATADGGTVKLAGFPATAIPASNRSLIDTLDSYGATGLMGVNLLHQYVARFDLANSTMTLYNAAGFDPDKSLSKPYAWLGLDVEDLIYAMGRLNQEVVGEVVIDTGLQLDLSLLSETLDHYGVELEKLYSRNSTVVGGVKSFDFVKVPSFDIGPLHLEDKTASLSSDDRGTMSGRHLLGFVGVFFFQNQRVTLDLFNQKMYIEPSEDIQQKMREQHAAGDGTAAVEDGNAAPPAEAENAGSDALDEGSGG